MADSESPAIVIFTDGACSGNPGPGGWGSIVLTADGMVREIGGGQSETTNNRMEMAAAIRALQLIESAPSCPIIVYTDSVYVIRGITQWIFGWRSRGWKSADGKDVANKDLWEALSLQVGRLKPAKIEWKYVRGHSGYAGNERCDEIAVSFSKGKREALYSGPREGYFIDLNDLPEEEPLPERNSSKGSPGVGSSGGGSKSGGGGPVTYLSYLNGVVMRHATWPACEKRVKGRNAKFKKAKSPQEEREILVSWGLDPNTPMEE